MLIYIYQNSVKRVLIYVDIGLAFTGLVFYFLSANFVFISIPN